ncbi:MAG TPA: hypothetical protein VND24_08730, partial [Steroidobacteraceae bacterium]|nr:hypothetical protein [Steroidobacteraceae bacterium]
MNKLALNRLNLWQKLGALVLAMLVPTVLVGFFYFTAMGGELSQAGDEIAGAHYLAALGAIESSLLTHEGRAFTLASGDKASRSAALAAQDDVTQAFERAAAVDAQLGLQYGVRQDFEALRSDWAALASATLQQNAEQGATGHDQLIERVRQLSSEVAAASGVASDPDRTTHSLLEAAAIDLPQALIDAGSLRRYAVDAASKGYLGGDDQMGIVISHRRLDSDLESVRTALGQLPASSRAQLTPVLRDAVSQLHGLYADVGSQLLKASNIKVSGGAMYEAGVPTDAALRKLLTASADAARSALRARASSLAYHRNVTALLALLALGGALALTRLVRLSLSRPLTRAIDAFEHISQGRYDNKLHTRR